MNNNMLYLRILRILTITLYIFFLKIFQPDSIDVDSSDNPPYCLTIAFCVLSLTLRASVGIFSVNQLWHKVDLANKLCDNDGRLKVGLMFEFPTLFFLCKEIQAKMILQRLCIVFYFMVLLTGALPQLTCSYKNFFFLFQQAHTVCTIGDFKRMSNKQVKCKFFSSSLTWKFKMRNPFIIFFLEHAH